VSGWQAIVNRAKSEGVEVLSESWRGFELMRSTSTGWWFGTCGLFFHVLGIGIPTD